MTTTTLSISFHIRGFCLSSCTPNHIIIISSISVSTLDDKKARNSRNNSTEVVALELKTHFLFVK